MSSCQTGDFVEEGTATNHLSEAENMPQEEEMEIDVFLDDIEDVEEEEEDMEVDEGNDANSEDFRNECTKDEECTEAVCHITVESKKLVTWQGSYQKHWILDYHCHRNMRSVDHIIPRILIGYHNISIHTT